MACCLCTKLQSLSKITILSKHRLSAIRPRVSIRLFSLKPKGAQFLNPPRSNVAFTRTFFLKFLLKPTPEKLKRVDGIPEHYKLIYRNTMHRYLFAAQLFTTLSAAVVCFLVLVYTKDDYYRSKTEDWRTVDQPKPAENEGMVYVTCFVTLCVMLQVMVSKMPIRIYNLPQREKYVFVFYGSLPATKRRLTCTVRDVIKLDESGLLPWRNCRYEILNKQRIIMLDDFFRRPADLNIMLGYQKPPEGYD